MFQWLGISAVNPLLLWGALAVAAPILIHLLSKRKFQVVSWAAMDFLFDAEKQNRRRVRMENFLLLLLRCLAMLLIALMLSRLLLAPLGMASFGLESAAVERIVLLDDSPSTQAIDGRQTSLDRAKTTLLQFVRELTSRPTGDTLTLILTSAPERPLASGLHLSGDGLTEAEQLIESLSASDLPANLDAALLELETIVRAPGGNSARAVYLFSDLRSRDWLADAAGSVDSKTIVPTLDRIEKEVDQLAIVDIGNGLVENLAVVDLQPQDNTLVANLETTFDVTVLNAGTQDASDVEVVLTAEHIPELRRTIEHIPAGETATVPFTLRLGRAGEVQLQASLNTADVMSIDNTRYYVARVLDGVQILIVDGDPSSDFAASESFYLQRALAPSLGMVEDQGSLASSEPSRPLSDALSGNTVEVVAENQFETLPLEKYQLIYLCNLYRISDERANALAQWTQAGGGLVLCLGEQTDPHNFNEVLYRDGAGLSPAAIVELQGDDTKQRWVEFVIKNASHPVLQLFEGIENALSFIHVFRWWKTLPAEEELKTGRIQVLAVATDDDASPLILERSFGNGRVLMLTTAIDADWSDWPADDTYPIVLEEIKRYMARSATGDQTFLVGAPLHYPLDPAKYQIDASLRLPVSDAEPILIQATLPTAAEASEAQTSTQPNRLDVVFDATDTQGLYRLELATRDGGTETVSFAANLEPTESQLQRLGDSQLRQLVGDKNIKVIQNPTEFSLHSGEARIELWKPLLLLLAGVLCLEQFLGWFFGRRRA